LFTGLFSLVVDDMMIAEMMSLVTCVRLMIVLLSLVVLFALHPTILEPDFDLPLRQVEIPC
jgi:hypothetical protein